eukprot:TRINITY_DN21725_c0_g1_i1.p1 TRINITY_DN21725_c0_g1~~TRINITY_DN21725_c0_g1_i1.p1  ORF type:complete len:587 (-),score=87.24 TRINITY_DN21725_c0_g1_i1:136-1851(-)
MGGALSAGDISWTCHVADYLTSTQARVALSAVRLDGDACSSVYRRLAENCVVPRGEDKELRAKVRSARRAGISAGLAPKDFFWSLQSLLCELCHKRAPCTRTRCSLTCIARTKRCRPLIEHADWCCECAGLFSPASNVSEGLAEMREAAATWECETAPAAHESREPGRCQARGSLFAPRSRQIQAPGLSECGAEAGGLMVSLPHFRLAETMFWKQVSRLRSRRLAPKGFAAMVAARCGAEIADLCERAGFFEPRRRDVRLGTSRGEHRVFEEWIWEIVHESYYIWQRVEERDEKAFFAAERKTANVARRAGTLLLKLEKQPKLAKELGRILVFMSKAEQCTARLVDIAGALLIGEHIRETPDFSTEGIARAGPLSRAVGRRLLNTAGLSYLSVTDRMVAELRQRIAALAEPGGEHQTPDEQEASKRLLQLCDARFPPFSKHYRGMRFIDVWAGDPACFRKLSRHLPMKFNCQRFHGEGFKDFYELAKRLDPERQRAVDSIHARFADHGTEDQQLIDLRIANMKAGRKARALERKLEYGLPIKVESKKAKRRRLALQRLEATAAGGVFSVGE